MGFGKYIDILRQGKKALDARGDQLIHKEPFLATLKALQEAILNKDKENAKELAQEVKKVTHGQLKKPFWRTSLEFVGSLTLAFLLAICVRQMWFELYQIPTGSMRPTFREQDHLTVTKTAFSLNVPLKAQHLWFDEKLVERTAPVVWSGEGTSLPDLETKYFGFIPYVRQYVKRVIGKPLDTLYFYGGKIYGVDQQGHLIDELINSPWMENLEHIPFSSHIFSADIKTNEIVAKLFQEPVMHQKKGLLGGTHFSFVDQAGKEKTTAPFGIDNYAQVRLLTKEQLQAFLKKDPEILYGAADLYLEINHHLRLPKDPRVGQRENEVIVQLEGETSYIPLEQSQIDALWNTLYTARFVVKNGKAVRYGSTNYQKGIALPKVPDGTYEFYYGKPSEVGKGAILYPLKDTHPLKEKSNALLLTLFNNGMEWYPQFNPNGQGQSMLPSRYSYFRQGDLYVMGGPIYSAKDPILALFSEKEGAKKLGFKDEGAPKTAAFILENGLKIPEKKYLLLGDNHANSLDSRMIGFVREENLMGVPSLILWPPGERLGVPKQKLYPLLSPPRIVVWVIVVFSLCCWCLYKKRTKKMPII
jgi:signal peptidase I